MEEHSKKISVSDLNEISSKLVKSFFLSSDIYSLLSLSLVTVTMYSRKKKHLSTQHRIELAIEFIPDLLKFLENDKIIDSSTKLILETEYDSKKEEFPLILKAFIYTSGGLRTKVDLFDKRSPQRKCCYFI